MDTTDDADAAQRLMEIVRSFETAMLVAADDDDLTRARPVTIVNRRAAPLPPHRMIFLTHRRNPLLANLDDDPYVCVTLQDRTRYVCLAGRATLDDDRLRIFSLWSHEWDPWFPGGASDINAVLIDCRMSFAELWDPTGAPSQRFALHAGIIQRLRPTLDPAAIGQPAALITDVLAQMAMPPQQAASLTGG